MVHGVQSVQRGRYGGDVFPADPWRHGVRLRRAEMDVQDHHCHTYAATNRNSAISEIFRNMVMFVVTI